jgi:hypothetical protein
MEEKINFYYLYLISSFVSYKRMDVGNHFPFLSFDLNNYLIDGSDFCTDE